MKDHLIIRGVQMILKGLEVPDGDRNYIKTPWRVLETYKEIFKAKVEFPATFEEQYDEMIIMRHHKAWAMCPHHLLPVQLDISIGYVPNGTVVGLSKMARIATSCMNGPVLQEKLTQDITWAMMDKIKPSPRGAAALIIGKHMCMQMRGVKTSGDVVTSSMRGVFLDKPAARDEFLSLTR